MVDTTYRILLLGDFHFGESYSKAGARVLENKGYEHSTKYLLPFIDESDHVIVNLETPLVDPTNHPSPLDGKKSYIHWADPEQTPQALKALTVDAVSLANNHTMDQGRQGLLSTFESLTKAGIPWFGAGKNLMEARQPYVITLPPSMGGGEVYLHGSFQYSKHHDVSYQFYAKESSPGCAPLSKQALKDATVREGAESAFHISFPHWGANYDWRTPGQGRLAADLLGAGFDLVLGHGSHCVQEIVRSRRRWTVHSIGNGIFQSGGRFEAYAEKNNISPFGLWAILEITRKTGGERRATLKLYPVYSNNKVVDYQPKPVNEDDFKSLIDALNQRSRAAWHFENKSRHIGADKLGYFIGLDLGSWPVDGAPSRLSPLDKTQTIPSASDRSMSGRAYNDPDTVEILKQYGAGRNLGAILNSRAARRAGSDILWLADGTAVARLEDREILLNGYKCDESDLGARIVQDKYLLKKFLQDAGVATPNGFLAHTAADATQIAQRLGCPVVVKPRFGNKGKGISVNLKDPLEIEAAFKRALVVDGAVLVEEYIPLKEEFRCLATAAECVSVVKRILPNVTGDGKSTIRELVEIKNEARKLNPALYKRYIPIDDVMEHYLAQNMMGLDDVLEASRKITVRDVGGLSSGGEPHEFSNLVSNEVKVTAHSAVGAVPGLTWGGADIVTSQVSGRAYVIEINSDADISGATYPLEGPPADVASQMWKLRVNSSVPRIDGRPKSVRIDAEKPAIRDLVGKRQPASEVRLASDFFGHLSHSGIGVEREGPGIFRLTSHEGAKCWLTSEAMGKNDLSAVRRVMRKHNLTRRLLKEAQVPRVLGKFVRSASEVNAFVRSRGVTGVLFSPREEWDNPRRILVDRERGLSSDEFKFGSAGFVQEHVPLETVRVIATPEEVLSVVGPAEVELSNDLNERVSALAVRSVRAIPQLRWAAVDIRIRSVSASEGGSLRLLVCGITVNPRLDGDWHLLAGSLQKCFDLLNPFS